MFNIFTLVFVGVLLLALLLDGLRGARRGGLRAGIHCGLILLCAVLAFFCAQPIADSILAFDVSSLGFSLDGGAPFAGTLKDYILEVVASSIGEDIYGDLASASPTAVSLVASIVAAVIAEVVFLLAFFVFAIVAYIIYCIAKIFLPKANAGAKLKNRILGVTFNVVGSLISLFVILVPFMGTVNLAEKVDDAMRYSEGAQGAGNAALRSDSQTSLLAASPDGGSTEELMDLSFITDSAAYNFLEAVGIKSAAVGLFNNMYTAPISADGEKARLIDEVEKLIPVFADVMVISQSENVTAEQVCDLLYEVENSKLITGILTDVLRTASTKWTGGESFFGVSFDPESSEMDPYMAEVVCGILAEFSTLERVDLVADLDVVRESILLMEENHVMELASNIFGSGEGEEDDGEFHTERLGALLALLEAKTEHADGTTGTITADLFDTFANSSRLKAMIPALINIGLYSATTSMELPMDDAAMYDLMLEELTTALEGTHIDFANVDHAIRTNTPNGDYEAYMAEYKRVMRVFSNRGLTGYDGQHIYIIDGQIYENLQGEWTVVDHEDAISSVATLADTLIRYAAFGNVMDKEGILSVAASLSDTEISAAHLANKSLFVSEHATFRKIEVNGDLLTKADYPAVGEALAHMIAAFIDVIEHTEDAEISANVFLSLEYAALGTALDELYAIDATKDLCYGLMDVVTNMTDLEDQQSVRNAVSTLKFNLEHGDTTFTKFFGAVGAAVKISNRIESTEHIADLSWSESLKDLSNADSVSLDVVKEMLGGITNAEENTQVNTDMTNLMGTLIDSVNNNFQDADDETFEKEGEALKNTIAALEQSSSISDVIKGVAEHAAESELVKDVMLEAVITAGDRINNNEEYLSISFSRDEIVKTESGESHEGSEMMGAVIDSLTQMDEEHFTSDMQTLGTVMETLENSGVDFSSEHSADAVQSVLENEEIRTQVVEALQSSKDAGSSTFDAILALLNKRP